MISKATRNIIEGILRLNGVQYIEDVPGDEWIVRHGNMETHGAVLSLDIPRQKYVVVTSKMAPDATSDDIREYDFIRDAVQAILRFVRDAERENALATV